MLNSGSYQLIIDVSKDCRIKIGALGLCFFKKGRYVYTGSAMKNLEQRVARHKSNIKKIRWHIDYFLANKNTNLVETKIFPSLIREECIRNGEILDKAGSFVPVIGFGASDCKTCKAHLVGIKD